jgi:hypothetical protein
MRGYTDELNGGWVATVDVLSVVGFLSGSGMIGEGWNAQVQRE